MLGFGTNLSTAVKDSGHRGAPWSCVSRSGRDSIAYRQINPELLDRIVSAQIKTSSSDMPITGLTGECAGGKREGSGEVRLPL